MSRKYVVQIRNVNEIVSQEEPVDGSVVTAYVYQNKDAANQQIAMPEPAGAGGNGTNSRRQPGIDWNIGTIGGGFQRDKY